MRKVESWSLHHYRKSQNVSLVVLIVLNKCFLMAFNNKTFLNATFVIFYDSIFSYFLWSFLKKLALSHFIFLLKWENSPLWLIVLLKKLKSIHPKLYIANGSALRPTRGWNWPRGPSVPSTYCKVPTWWYYQREVIFSGLKVHISTVGTLLFKLYCMDIFYGYWITSRMAQRPV